MTSEPLGWDGMRLKTVTFEEFDDRPEVLSAGARTNAGAMTYSEATKAVDRIYLWITQGVAWVEVFLTGIEGPRCIPMHRVLGWDRKLDGGM